MNEPLDIKFTTEIVSEKNSGWACVLMQNSVEIFGTGKSVKVKGTVEGEAYKATVLNSWNIASGNLTKA